MSSKPVRRAEFCYLEHRAARGKAVDKLITYLRLISLSSPLVIQTELLSLLSKMERTCSAAC
jgi:hypothetical protein